MGAFAKLWAKLKNDNVLYSLNKSVSVIVAAVFAGMTIHITATTPAEQKVCEGGPNFRLLYWLLFIYYSFQALDELIELFSVMTERSKGALGLMFELNYFLGVALSVYVMHAVWWHPECESQTPTMFNWIKFQLVFFFVAAGLALFTIIIMAIFQRRVAVTKYEAQKSAQIFKELKGRS